MKIITNRNKEYSAIYIDGPTRIGGALMMRVEDSRPIIQVGTEFDGLEWIRRESTEQGNKEWSGYTRLISIREVDAGVVLIELAKGADF